MSEISAASGECLFSQRFTGVAFSSVIEGEEMNKVDSAFLAIIDADNQAHEFATRMGCRADRIVSIRQDRDSRREILKDEEINEALTIQGLPAGERIEVDVVIRINCC
jgi:uncharacterized protein YggE